MQQSVSRRERDPNVRRHALMKYGRACMICGFDFREVYGAFANSAAEVHHLDQLSSRSKRGHRTRLDDVIVVCPNKYGLRTEKSFLQPLASEPDKVMKAKNAGVALAVRDLVGESP